MRVCKNLAEKYRRKFVDILIAKRIQSRKMKNRKNKKKIGILNRIFL